MYQDFFKNVANSKGFNIIFWKSVLGRLLCDAAFAYCFIIRTVVRFLHCLARYCPGVCSGETGAWRMQEVSAKVCYLGT